MAVTYTLRFTPDISAAELHRFARRLGEWMAKQSGLRVGRPGRDDHATRDRVGRLPECNDKTESISGEQISIGPDLFGPERALEIVLHPALFLDVRIAEQSLLELIEEFPIVSWERAEDG